MAGLPKAAVVSLLTFGIAMTFAFGSVADEIQTDSVVLPPVLPPEDVQTDSNVLQPVFDLIAANPYADPIDQASLAASFEEAVTMGVLTPEEALAMLELVQWETLGDTADLSNVSAAIQTILGDLVFGTLLGDPLVELTQLLNVLATPEGTLTAISHAGASEEILDQVSSIVASGVPPGILVRITKEGIRDGLSMEEITAQLDAVIVAVAADEDSWGQIANDVTGDGEYQDQEQNENIDGSEEPEVETNEHGDGDDSADNDNNGKKGAPPGQEDKDDK